VRDFPGLKRRGLKERMLERARAHSVRGVPLCQGGQQAQDDVRHGLDHEIRNDGDGCRRRPFARPARRPAAYDPAARRHAGGVRTAPAAAGHAAPRRRVPTPLGADFRLGHQLRAAIPARAQRLHRDRGGALLDLVPNEKINRKHAHVHDSRSNHSHDTRTHSEQRRNDA